MRPEFSAYLDLLRVGAALLVFLGHLSWRKLSGGALWPLQPYGHAAVIVFFVLSGFVIQHVVREREPDFRAYLVARFARLYSVVLPALLLTLVLDVAGNAIRPDLYVAARQDDRLWRLVINGVFLSQSWGWNLTLLSNEPYWSIPYEFWYYLIFGGAVFLRDVRRNLWVAACLLSAGPAIVIDLPIWLMGVMACRAVAHRPLGRATARALFVLTALALLGGVFAQECGLIVRQHAAWLPRDFAWIDFAQGALVAIHLYAAAFLDMPLHRLARPVAWAAGFSFALYLFHMPLLHFGAALLPADWPVPLRGSVLAGMTLLLVWTLGHVSERRKSAYAREIERLWAMRLRK